MKELCIQTLKLETQISDVALNKEIQERLITLFNTSLKQEIGNVFDQYFNNEHVVIEQIELDLSVIPLEFLENKYTTKTKEQLTIFLNELILKSNANKKQLTETTVDYKHIFYFLNNGVFPWYYNTHVSFSKVWLKSLQSVTFFRLIKKNNWGEQMIKRLLYHLNESQINTTIQFLTPEQSLLIITYHNAIFNQYTTDNIKILDSVSKLKEVVYVFTLNYLLNIKGTRFNRKQFVLWHLKKLSAHYNLSIINLLHLLRQSFFNLKNHETSELLSILQELTIHTKQQFHLISFEDIERMLLLKDTKTNEALAMKKRIIASKELVQKRWINSLKESLLEEGLKVLVPKQSQKIIMYQSQLWIHHQKKSSIPLGTFKKSVWHFTYLYVLNPFSSYFNLKGFLDYHLQKLAMYYNISVNYFTQTLTTYFKLLALKNNKFQSLYLILKSLCNHTDVIDGEINSITDVAYYLSQQKITDSQKIVIKEWLFKNDNFSVIKQRWIDTSNTLFLHKIIEIITPANANFILDYVTTVVQTKFNNADIQITSKYKFQADVYTILLSFFLKAPSSYFSKKIFLKQQIEKLAQKYKVSFFSFLNILINAKAIQNKLVVFTVLASLKKEEEVIIKSYKNNHQFNFELLMYFFKTGKTRGASNTDLQYYFIYVLKNELDKWLYYIVKQNKKFNINNAVKNQFINQSKSIVELFTRTLSRLQKIDYVVSSLNDFYFLCFIFYAKHGVTPFHIQKRKNTLKKLSKKQLQYLIKHKPIADKALLILMNFSQQTKMQMIVNYSNKCENLSFLYANLIPLKFFLQVNRINYLLFEKYFWRSFFKSVTTLNASETLFNYFMSSFKNDIKPYVLNTEKLECFNFKLKNNEFDSKNQNILEPKKEIQQIFNTENQNEKWFILHAGLVLLTPFIPHLFNLLDYTTLHKKFELEDKFRAVYLLAYIITGEKIHKEQDLVLEKLLCGLPIHTPLPVIDLTDDEIEKANMLLKQVIINWDALKNTSKEGLRNTFLLREGVLEQQEIDLVLKVEVRGFDIMLDNYPWSFSFIKFSWMDVPLHVDWR